MSCSTADCQGIAVAYVTCEGEGAYPYCKDCADTLTAGWEDYKGPVEIPDEMVERAARWVFAHRQQEDKLVRSGLIEAQSWEDVPEGCWAHEDARETARGVLSAALHWTQPLQEEHHD